MKILITKNMDEDIIIDLNNVMGYGCFIGCNRQYITTESEEVWGFHFTVLDKNGEMIPNCVAVNPKRRRYKQYHTDENGKLVGTEDGEWSGILRRTVEDDNIQVVYNE